jgi:hypothetical protein
MYPGKAELLTVDGGYALRAPLADGGEAVMVLPSREGATVEGFGLRGSAVTVQVTGKDGKVVRVGLKQ